MRPGVVGRKHQQSTFLGLDALGQVQELSFATLLNIVEVQQVDTYSARVCKFTIFAMPDMVPTARLSLLDLVGVYRMLLVVGQNAVLGQIVLVARIPKHRVELTNELGNVGVRKRNLLRGDGVQADGLILLEYLLFGPVPRTVICSAPLKVFDDVVAELVGKKSVVDPNKVVVFNLVHVI